MHIILHWLLQAIKDTAIQKILHLICIQNDYCGLRMGSEHKGLLNI